MKNLFWIVLLALVVVRIGFFLYTKPSYPDGTKLRITERATSEPVQYSNSQYLKLSGFKVYLPKYPKVSYGDTVILEGFVEDDKISDPHLIEVKETENLLYGFRENLITFYNKSLPTPHSSLVSGVVLGSKSGIGEDFWQSLISTGTAHVVVASGMNVTLVAKFLIGVLVLFLKRRWAIPLAILGVLFYSILSGFDAPIIRASIMGILAFTAQELGKMYYAGRTLVISIALMLLVWPNWLFDIGFILSVVATASIIIFDPKIKRRLKSLPKVIREDLSTTLSAQIGVAPVLFVSFGQFNVFSPLINVAILWTIPLITMIGMVSGLVGVVFEPLGRLILLLVYPLTSWFVFVVQLLG